MRRYIAIGIWHWIFKVVELELNGLLLALGRSADIGIGYLQSLSPNLSPLGSSGGSGIG